MIAELFLEGVPIFEYHQLLSYRKGEYNPIPVINRINDPNIESLVIRITFILLFILFSPLSVLFSWRKLTFSDMINKDPSKRLSAGNYLQNWYGAKCCSTLLPSLSFSLSFSLSSPPPPSLSLSYPSFLSLTFIIRRAKLVFPEYFQFLHSHVHQLLKMSPDDRIVCLDANFDNYIKIFTKQITQNDATSTEGM